jgi:uncharacterized protein YkwD
MAKSGGLILALLFLLSISLVAAQRPGEPEIRIPDLERQIHQLINVERDHQNLERLKFDDDLAKIARDHSADMAKRKFFDHVNPDHKNATDRGKAAGYTCRKSYGNYFTNGLAENIFQGNLYSRVTITNGRKSYSWNTPEQIARDTVNSWMRSEGHRKNILDKNFDKEGIGIAIDENDQVLVTQDLC